MVHNGIEYGDMQLICEAYDFMQHAMGMGNTEMQQVFSNWDKGELNSYLIEITANILGFKNEEGYVVGPILEKAGQKGTGKWTGINALELGIPLTLIGEAVFARCLSALKEERVNAAHILSGPTITTLPDKEHWITALGEALLAAKIISYTQGYMLMAAAAEEYQWKLQYGSIAQMWRGGCIIRSAFLDDIKNAFDKDANLPNLLLDSYFNKSIENTQSNWRKTVAKAIELGIPVPAMAPHCRFTTAIELPGYLPTCCRHREITLVRTLTKDLTSQASVFIPTGPVKAEMFQARATLSSLTFKVHLIYSQPARQSITQ